MKINVYGCSWSSGVPDVDDHACWPQYFAEQNPNYKIKNYALGGTSIQYQARLFMKYKHTADVNIFQGTSAHRWTDFDPSVNLEDGFIRRLPNYSYLPRKWASHNQKLKTYQVAKTKRTKMLDMKQSYYYAHLKYYSDEYMHMERYAIMDMLSRQADLCFWHRERDSYGYTKHTDNKLLCIQEHIDWKYIGDDGEHLRNPGLKQVARLIKECLDGKT